MAENSRQVQSTDPFERFDDAIEDPGLYETTYQAHEFPGAEASEPDPPARDHLHNDPVPLFLANQHDAHYRHDDRYRPTERDQDLPGYQ